MGYGVCILRKLFVGFFQVGCFLGQVSVCATQRLFGRFALVDFLLQFYVYLLQVNRTLFDQFFQMLSMVLQFHFP